MKTSRLIAERRFYIAPLVVFTLIITPCFDLSKLSLGHSPEVIT